MWLAESDTRKMIANHFRCTVKVVSFLMDIVPRQVLMFELQFLAVVGMPMSYYLIDLGRETDNNIQASLGYIVSKVLAKLSYKVCEFQASLGLLQSET